MLQAAHRLHFPWTCLRGQQSGMCCTRWESPGISRSLSLLEIPGGSQRTGSTPGTRCGYFRRLPGAEVSRSDVVRATVTAGRGRFRLQADAVCPGADMLVAVFGGDRPHIGAVTVSVAHPRRSTPGTVRASTSSCVLPGHCDEGVARIFSERLCCRFGRTAVATAGIHLDNITAAEIDTVMQVADRLCQRLITALAPRLRRAVVPETPQP